MKTAKMTLFRPYLAGYKKDNGQGENENAETETPSRKAEANISQAADTNTSPEPNTNNETINETSDETGNEAGSSTPATQSDAEIDDLAGLATKLSKPDTDDQLLDLTSIEQHLPEMPEVGAIEEDEEKQDNKARLNWPLAIFGAIVIISGLLAGVLYF